ncbi:MAG: hypothetical protein WAL91_04400 [Propionicimonas sp.]
MAGQNAARTSWLSLLGLPVALLASFALASWAGSLAGVEPGGWAPVWLAVLLFVMVAVLFGAAVAVTYRFCRKAAAAGVPRAMLPAWIALAVGVLVVVQNVAGYFFA